MKPGMDLFLLAVVAGLGFGVGFGITHTIVAQFVGKVMAAIDG